MLIAGINIKQEDGSIKFKFVFCSKIEMYRDGGISFKDDEDGILYSLQIKHIDYISIIEDD